MPAIPDEQDGLLLGSAITIIIEDGTIVANANSYVSINDLLEYASNRNVDMTAVDEDILASYLIIASDYMESFISEYKGVRIDLAQELEWPRQYVSIYPYAYLDPEVIPDGIKEAQMQLAIAQFNGIDLNPVRTKPLAILRQVGPIITKYSDRIGTSPQPKLYAFERLLAPFIRHTQGIAARG